MHTLFDYITHVKIIEYLIALSFIAVFIVFLEALKPHPFRGLIENGKDDLHFVKEEGMKNLVRSIGKIISAPFIGLAYVIALPFGFVAALSTAAIEGLAGVFGKSASFGWRPAEAYLGGKKKEKNKAADHEEGKKDE